MWVATGSRENMGGRTLSPCGEDREMDEKRYFIIN